MATAKQTHKEEEDVFFSLNINVGPPSFVPVLNFGHLNQTFLIYRIKRTASTRGLVFVGLLLLLLLLQVTSLMSQIKASGICKNFKF